MMGLKKIGRWLGLGERRSGAWAAAWLAGREETLGPVGSLVSAYEQSSMVYACVSFLAECVASVPVSDGSSTSRSMSPPPSKFHAEKLHPGRNWFEFIELLVVWLMLRGTAFVANYRGEFILLSPEGFTRIMEGRKLIGWRYRPPCSYEPQPPFDFLPEEVTTFRLPNPYDPYVGLSPLSAANLAAQTDFAASQFMKGTMLNNADTGLIVSTEEQVTTEQRDQILAALRERKRSGGSADHPLFLWGGAKVEKPTVSAADFNLLAQRKFSRQEICAVYRVPEQLLGFSEDANRSVSEVARIAFFENRIVPLCARLSIGFAPLFGEGFAFLVDEHPVMVEARRLRLGSAKVLADMGLPLAEINRYLRLNLNV